MCKYHGSRLASYRELGQEMAQSERLWHASKTQGLMCCPRKAAPGHNGQLGRVISDRTIRDRARQLPISSVDSSASHALLTARACLVFQRVRIKSQSRRRKEARTRQQLPGHGIASSTWQAAAGSILGSGVANPRRTPHFGRMTSTPFDVIQDAIYIWVEGNLGPHATSSVLVLGCASFPGLLPAPRSMACRSGLPLLPKRASQMGHPARFIYKLPSCAPPAFAAARRPGSSRACLVPT
ncbi:hypothetical protein B0T26DRAFT_403904 [Lasiosphaeria miniovina]|uniref:Uncharacterized protein n=1 Tax=Lasiosphaeria miniovina TaxID=1954250 RepID=A0AA40DQD2_9PEZI|nr:uncharacterized protein B0T26DRAFT_403904 [Lasiosphaeria miniovina]KAK0709387.1 hypothetical protein B0T26DRAFT_403904 [Lasiosphaeria miniovina]